MNTLDEAAWQRWIAYRTAIKKPLKAVSLEAAKLNLARYGEDQAAVVDRSISNQWTGLFDLQKSKERPDEKKRTKEQQAAADANFEWMQRESEKGWNRDLAKSSIHTKLLLADALLARYDNTADQGSVYLVEQRSWLRGRVGQLISECHDKATLTDFTIRRLVLQLFGGAGLRRMEQRAAQA